LPRCRTGWWTSPNTAPGNVRAKSLEVPTLAGPQAFGVPQPKTVIDIVDCNGGLNPGRRAGWSRSTLSASGSVTATPSGERALVAARARGGSGRLITQVEVYSYRVWHPFFVASNQDGGHQVTMEKRRST
jgi:hypothetical protein